MNPGEIVQLKSGGEAMTVEFVDQIKDGDVREGTMNKRDFTSVQCVWWHRSGEPARERSALAALQLYDAAKDATRGVFVPDRPPPTSLPGMPGNRSVR